MDSNGLYDIYGMLYVPWWQRPLFLWIISILGALVVLLVVAIVIKKVFFKKKPKKSWEIAILMLSKAHGNAGKKDFDAAAYYAQVTGILKGYLIARYRYDLVGRTDSELLAYIQEQHDFPAAGLPLLVGLFERAQMVKFAKKDALADQIGQDYAVALQIIQQTIPIEKTEQQA